MGRGCGEADLSPFSLGSGCEPLPLPGLVALPELLGTGESSGAQPAPLWCKPRFVQVRKNQTTALEHVVFRCNLGQLREEEEEDRWWWCLWWNVPGSSPASRSASRNRAAELSDRSL